MLLILLPLLLLLFQTIDCDDGNVTEIVRNATKIVVKWKMIDEGCGVVKGCWADAACFGAAQGDFLVVDQETYKKHSVKKDCPMGLTVRRLNSTKLRVDIWVPGNDTTSFVVMNGGFPDKNINREQFAYMQTINNITYGMDAIIDLDFFNTTRSITLYAGKFGQVKGSIKALDLLPQRCPIEEPIIVDDCSDGFECLRKDQIERVELPKMSIVCNSSDHQTQILYNGTWTFVNLSCPPAKSDEHFIRLATDANGGKVIGDAPLKVRCAYLLPTPPPTTPPPPVTDMFGYTKEEAWKGHVLIAGYATVPLIILIVIAIIIWCCFAKIRTCCGCAKEDTVGDPEVPELIDLEPGQAFQVLDSSYEVTKVFENRSSRDVHFRVREDEGGFSKHLNTYPHIATVKPNEKLAVRIAYRRNAPPRTQMTFVYECAFTKFRKDGSRKAKRYTIPCVIPDVLTKNALLNGADDDAQSKARVISDDAASDTTHTDSAATKEEPKDIPSKLSEDEVYYKSSRHSTDRSASRESNIHHDETPLIDTKRSKKNNTKRRGKEKKMSKKDSGKSGMSFKSRKSVSRASGRSAARSLKFFKVARSSKSNNSITGTSAKSRTGSYKEHESCEQLQQTQD